MALAGPTSVYWRREAPLLKHGVRWSASWTAQGRGVKTGLSQRGWWRRDGHVGTSTSSLRSSSNDAPGAGDEESSAQRDVEDVHVSRRSARPPTPTPVFRRRPKRKNGRPRLMDLPSARLALRSSPVDSEVSLQASRQQNALFKGLARQMTDLSALGLPSSQALQNWRSTIEDEHTLARKPGRKKGVVYPKPAIPAKARKCGVCGAEGHNARTCALSVHNQSPNDLVSYYESKYGSDDSDEGSSGDDERTSSSAGPISLSKSMLNAGRPTSSKTIAVKCSVCGKYGHNKRSHSEKKTHKQRYTGPVNGVACRCSACGGRGHNSRGCPSRRGKVSGYGFAYGFSYGRSYGYKYGYKGGGGGWVVTQREYDLESESTKRDKVLELRAATLWLRSKNRTPRNGTPKNQYGSETMSVADACALVGVHKRFKQNVWNATRAMEKKGWVDDHEGDEFLEVEENQEVNPQANVVEVEVA